MLSALGIFEHEAAVVDPITGFVYLTEDVPDGRFYRFCPDGTDLSGRPNLRSGQLQVIEILSGQQGAVRWHDIPDPHATSLATRYQVTKSTAFDGGEGAWYSDGRIYFSTKGDNRIWMLDLGQETISIVYDMNDYSNPILRGVDNITVSPRGDILVAEDGDDLQIVAITVAGDVVPILQLTGHGQSEVTGPAFDPSGSRLYFSSQRGVTGTGSGGLTFEVSGAFPW